MKSISLLIISSLLYISVNAQNKKSDLNLIPEGMRSYQFQLEKEARSISNIHYEKTGEPIKGKLSPDGKRIIMEHYVKGNRVVYHVVYADGTEADATKSTCYIDPVAMEL